MAASRHQQRFTVYINEGEKHQIEEWVKKWPNTETGGDLFGAWKDDHTAVVQFVLGPGKECRRTGASFYQDVDYLRDAGSYLTQQHGLCNIGQWHSHHQLGLTRPSGGDENTVWSNMPKLGLNRYIVFIATITGGSRSYYPYNYGDYYRSSSNEDLEVHINPYLFEIKYGRRMDVLPGSFKYIKYNSPFRLNEAIINQVRIRAEVTNLVKYYEIPVETSQKRLREGNEIEAAEPKTKSKPKVNEEGEYSKRTEDAEHDSDVSDQNEQSGQSKIQLERVANHDVLDEERVVSPTTDKEESEEKQPETTATVNDKISTSEGDRIEQESLKSKTEKENVILTSDNLPDIHQPSTLQEDRSHINGQAEGKSVDPTLATHENEGAADEDMNMDTGTSLTGNIPKQNEQDRSSNNSNSEVSKTDDKDKGQLKGDIVTPADDDLQRDQGTQSSTQLDLPTENLQETSQNSEKHENNKDEVKSDTGGGIQDEKKDQPNNPQENDSDNHLLAQDGPDDKSKSKSTTSYQDPKLKQDGNNDDDDNGTVFAGESSVEDTDEHLRETSQTDLDIHRTHGESDASVVHLGYGSVEEQNGLSSIAHGNFDRNLTNDTKLTTMERQEEQHQSDTTNTNGIQASNSDTQQDIEQDPSQNNSGRMHENETDQGKADDTDDQREHSSIRNEDGENDFKYDSDKRCKGITAAVNGGLNNAANGSDKEIMPKIEDQNTNETNRESTVKDPKDNLLEDMEVDNLNPSSEDKDTDFNEDLGIQKHTEDRSQNSMMTLPNTTSDTAVKATEGLEEQSEQPIQMSETLELEEASETTTVIDNNDNKIMSQEELNESDKKQSFDEGSHSITKLDGHLKNDHANNDDAIANASDPEETFDKTRRENMDVEDQNSSAQSKATGIDRRRGTDEDTEDQNSMKKNSMRRDAAVKPMEGFEEQSDQPIQKSENQSKTPEWGEVDDIFKTITKELETSDVDNNKSNNNGDLIAKQESSVINDRRENVCKNIMDAQTDDILTNSPPSPATEGNDGSNKEGNEFLHGVDAEDQDLKGMTTLQNVRSGITTVEHIKRLEKKSEHIQKSENQPKTPEWGEILNGIFNENIDNLTIIQPSAATGGTGQSNKKTDEEDPPSNTAGLIDEENFGKKITKNGRDDVYKTSESSTAVASRSRSIFDPFPQKLFDDGCHSSDDKVPNAETVETAVVESIMPESTQQLESSNDKENIQEQGQKEKVTKKLEEKQDTIEVKDDAKNVNPKEIAGQSKQANDSMDVIKELGSDGGQAEENDKKETSKEKNKEENINKVGKSQKDEGNDGCFPFLTKRKKRRKSKAKEERDESDDRKERKEIKSQKKGKKSKAKEKKDESDDGKEWKEIKSEKKGKKSKAKEKKEESDDGKGSKGIESQKKGKKSKTKEKKDETDDGKKGKENKSEKKGKKSKANKKN